MPKIQLSDVGGKSISDFLIKQFLKKKLKSICFFFLLFILVFMSMVHHHHVVFSILIIVYHPHHHIINNMVLQIQIRLIKQQQQRVLVECIDANHFCINVTVTMIFHQNVFRAIRPSDLNCK